MREKSCIQKNTIVHILSLNGLVKQVNIAGRIVNNSTYVHLHGNFLLNVELFVSLQIIPSAAIHCTVKIQIETLAEQRNLGFLFNEEQICIFI